MSIITFLTDFGLNDGYVGCVKGVILSIDSSIQIIDITHNIYPYSIEEASYTILTYYNYYPKDTIHLAVIDPGVGGNRIPLIIKTKKYYFVGPDNGIFSYIIQKEKYHAYGIEIDKLKKYYTISISNTFHARDIFGPVAALLTKGILPADIGYSYDSKVNLIKTGFSINKEEIVAKIIYVDRFGNVISNFSINDYQQLKKRRITEIAVKDLILYDLKNTYNDVKKGEFLALFGSSGFLEIAINQGNAAKELNCKIKKDLIKIKFT